MRRVPTIILILMGVWIIISLVTALLLPDLPRPYLLQVVDIMAIFLILVIIVIELELQLRSDRGNLQSNQDHEN